MYLERPAQAQPGVEDIPVRLSTGPNPLDVPDPKGKPWPIHFNVYDLANENEGKKNWTQEAVPKNRARGNLICGRSSPSRAISSTRRPRRGTRRNCGAKRD